MRSKCRTAESRTASIGTAEKHDLKPVLANIAREEGLQVRLVSDTPPDPASMTDWVLIATSPDAFNAENLSVAEAIEPTPGFSLWTDQFNNLLDVLKSSPVEEIKRLVSE